MNSVKYSCFSGETAWFLETMNRDIFTVSNICSFSEKEKKDLRIPIPIFPLVHIYFKLLPHCNFNRIELELHTFFFITGHVYDRV